MQNHQTSMHDLQLRFSRLTIASDLMPVNQPRPSSFPPPVVDSDVFMAPPQLPESFFAGPVNQGMMMVQQPQGQYPSYYLSRAPSWGPSRHQRRLGSHEAEALQPYNTEHELSGTITRDRSTGNHPGVARMDAKNNAGAEKVWRTPSRNP